MNTAKKQLGQFYTTNAPYLFDGLMGSFESTKNVIDPFAGNWDILNLASQNGFQTFGFDIDPQNEKTIRRDTLLCPPPYDGYLVFTNPPYLARNKSPDKTVFNTYQTDDLYKASLKTMLGCDGGIIVLPLNFFSSKEYTIRSQFLSSYKVLRVNVFEESVFEDTTYTVCVVSFVKSGQGTEVLDFHFYPSREQKTFAVCAEQNYQIGAEYFAALADISDIKISRVVGADESNSNLFLRALDSGSQDKRISLSVQPSVCRGKVSDRAFATLTTSVPFSIRQQNLIAEMFNSKLERFRDQYRSMFLSAFRNSVGSNSRKRIAFEDAYLLVRNVIKELRLDAN